MILGLVSFIGAGKDTVASYLVKKGFIHRSLSDEIRDELKKRKLPETRDNLINVGNELRKKFGNDVLAKRAFEKIKKLNKHAIISSIRNAGEVKFFKKQPEFILVEIYCPLEIRYKRLKKRNRIGDIKSFKEFLLSEKREQASDPSKQQIHKVIKLADLKINNSGTIKQLQNNTDNLINKINKGGKGQK